MSGGITGAHNQSLAFMVGGAEAAFDQVSPLLKGMGKNLFHVGGPGAGGVAKLTNNLTLGLHMIALAEGLQIG